MSDDQTVLFADIVKQRRSVRGFLPEPVAPDIIQQVFKLARYAPSNCNAQPWHVYVVSGDSCEQLRQQLCQRIAAGEMQMDFPWDLRQYHGIYKERQVAAAKALFSAMGIGREDRDKRDQSFMRNFNFFNAPHAAFFFLPNDFSVREAADVGMYAQTVMLGLTAHGIGCCPQTTLSFHADCVREVLGIDDSLKLLFGLSFGYEDSEEPANRCRTERASANENIHFMS